MDLASYFPFCLAVFGGAAFAIVLTCLNSRETNKHQEIVHIHPSVSPSTVSRKDCADCKQQEWNISSERRTRIPHTTREIEALTRTLYLLDDNFTVREREILSEMIEPFAKRDECPHKYSKLLYVLYPSKTDVIKPKDGSKVIINEINDSEQIIVLYNKAIKQYSYFRYREDMLTDKVRFEGNKGLTLEAIHKAIEIKVQEQFENLCKKEAKNPYIQKMFNL